MTEGLFPRRQAIRDLRWQQNICGPRVVENGHSRKPSSRSVVGNREETSFHKVFAVQYTGWRSLDVRLQYDDELWRERFAIRDLAFAWRIFATA